MSELLIVVLPSVVIGNMLIVMAPKLWIYCAAAAVVTIAGYLPVGTYQHHRQAESWCEPLFSMPDPGLWTPKGDAA